MKKCSLFKIIIILFGFSTTHLTAQNISEKIDDYVLSWYKTNQFNGCVLVAKDDDILYEKGFGYANFEDKLYNNPKSKFNIGSISKQFTTVLLFKLIDSGLLDLNGKISDYLPEYRKDTGSKITIDNLLRHTSGIPCYLRDYQRQSGDDFRLPFQEWNHFQRSKLIKDYLSKDLLFEPGSKYRYSNTNFYLLYLIIEKVTEKSFEQNLQDRIFKPLGMQDSGLLDDYKLISNLASGYNKTPAGFMHAKYTYAPNTYGAGSIYSTVEDLFIWNRALRSGKILTEKWQNKMLTPYMDLDQYFKIGYSIEFHKLRRENESESVWFTSFNGALSGYITDAFTFPSSGHTIIIFDNTEQFNHTSIAVGIYKILNGWQFEKPKPLVADLIGEIALKKGVTDAIERYRDLKKNDKAEYDFESIDEILKDQGYMLADAGMMDSAVTILKLIIELNPNATRAYEALSNIYKKMENTTLSENYRKQAITLEKRNSKIYDLMKNGKFDEAKALVESIQRQFPNGMIFISSEIGPFFEDTFSRGKIEKAKRICELWSLGNPGDVGPYFSLGRIYLQIGKKDEAKKCYEKILQIAPYGRYASHAKRKLDELKK